MSKSQAPAVGTGAVTTLPGVLNRPAATLTAVQAVQHIRACVAITRTLVELARAQIAEAAWIVRREHPERAAFERFVSEQGIGDAMSPGQAWREAEAWDVMRRQRPLRELAHNHHDEAVRLALEFVDGGGDTGALDEDDRRITEILSQPKRKRTELLREMARAQRAAPEGRHPGDLEQIRTLTEERDAALEEIARIGHASNVVRTTDAPTGHVRELHRELSELLGKVTDITTGYEAFMELAGPPGERSSALESAANAVARLADDLIEQAERILGATSGDTDDETD